MELLSSDALLLDVVDLHEVDRIVTFLTPARGRKRGVARGARRKFSRFAGQLQPLAKVRVQWVERPDRELVRISGVELVRSAEPLQRDLEGILLGSYLAEHMVEFVQEDESAELPYRLLDSTLEALFGGVDRSLAARYFEAWVLRLSGIFPPPERCPSCDRSLFAEGAVLPANGEALLCRACGGSGPESLRVPDAVLDFLRLIGRQNLPDMQRHRIPQPVLDMVERLCRRVRREFLQRELKSYDVMRRTLKTT